MQAQVTTLTLTQNHYIQLHLHVNLTGSDSQNLHLKSIRKAAETINNSTTMG